MRYAFAVTAALLAGATAASVALQAPGVAQQAQNEPGTVAATTPPRPGAPMSFADLAARLQPAVVNISTTQRIQISRNNPFEGTPFGDLFGGQFGDNKPITREGTSLGSGFIVSPDGYIVTNNHVVSGGQGPARNSVVSSIKVTLPDRTEYEAKLVGRDPASDIAVLKISTSKPLPFVKFGDSARTRVGDWVVAIGNPFGLGGTVTAGIVSALNRVTGQGGPTDRYIQTDASINQGNSGGPMFDLNGNVIGINTMIFTPSGGNVGIGFAIPAEEAIPIVESLRKGAKIQRGYLGVSIQPLDEGIADSIGIAKNRGELVARVEPNEGAAKAGIQAGDVIVRIAGQEVTPDNTLSHIVASQKIGTRVPVELIREGKRMTLNATIGERPSEDRLASLGADEGQGMEPENEADSRVATRESLGLALQPLTPEISRQLGIDPTTRGVVIGAVDPSSDAAAKGLQRGDVIISVNYKQATSPEDVARAANSAKSAGRQNVLLFVQRGRTPARYLAVKLRQG